jgi:hypothetical protein
MPKTAKLFIFMCRLTMIRAINNPLRRGYTRALSIPNTSQQNSPSSFVEQNKMAEDILTNYRGKILAVRKATRSGATFSLIKAACEKNQRTVIILPHKNAFKIVEEAAASAITSETPKVVKLKSNREMCRVVDEGIKQNPNRQKLPFHSLGDCENCLYFIGCPLQEILKGDWDILCTSYAKLKALRCSSSDRSQKIMTIIADCDNIVMDDFLTGLLGRLPNSVLMNKLKLADYLEKEFSLTQTINNATTPYEKIFWNSLKTMAEKIDQQTASLLDSDSRIIKNPLSDEERKMLQQNFSVNYSIIEELVHKDIKLLYEVMQLFNAKLIHAQHLEKRDWNQRIIEESTVLTPLTNKEWLYALTTSGYIAQTIYAFSQNKGKMQKVILPNKSVLLVDSCLPDSLFLENLIGIALYRIHPQIFVWDDPSKTNKSQLVICDTTAISKTRFVLNDYIKERLVSAINEISLLHCADKIVLCCLNKEVYKYFDTWQNDDKTPKRMKIPKDITLTTYHIIRAKVEPDPKRNVLVLTGSLFIPEKAEVVETKDPVNVGLSAFSSDELGEASQIKELRLKSLFVNALSVVKDPTGLNLSYVYALGVTKKQAQGWLYDKDSPMPLVETFPAKGAKAGDFRLAGEILLSQINNGCSLEDALILTRVISRVRHCGKLSVRKIIQKCGTKRIRELVDKNRKLLESFGLRYNYTRNGGLSLSYLDS